MSDSRLDIQFGAQTAPLEEGVAKAQSVVEAGAAAIIAAIQAMSAQVTAAIETMSTALANKSRAAADAAQTAIQQMATWRQQLLEQKAASDGNRRAELAADVAFWQEKAALAHGDAKLELQVATELTRARVALSREEIADAHRAESLKLQGDKDHALAAINLAERQVKEEARLHTISAQQELTELTALAAQKREIMIGLAEDEFALSDLGAAAEQRAANAKIKAWDDYRARVQQVTDQITKAQEKSAEQAARAWENAFRSVDSAFNTVVRGVLSGHETLRQALAKGAQSFVTSELEADAKVLFNKLALFAGTKAGFISTDAAELASKQQATGGIITSLLFRRTTEQTADATTVATHTAAETAKTIATRTGAAARATANAGEETSLLGRIGNMLARWLGLETGKTSATEAGVTVRTTAVTTEQATALAQEVLTGYGKIQIAAAVSAAEAFADSASLGPPGLAAAPEVAAAAYAATIGWAAGLGGGIAGFEEGTSYVPSTGLALLHEGERVIPASQNTAGARGGFGGGDTHFHVGPIVLNATMRQEIEPEELVGMIADSARNGTIQRALQQARASL